MRGDNQIRKVALEGAHLEFIHGEAANEKNGPFEYAIGHNGAHVIPGISHMQSVDDIFKLLSLVLQVNHV